jgi:nucleotide-binding universal stress UspA family protein
MAHRAVGCDVSPPTTSSLRLERIVIGMDFSASAIEATAWTARHFARNAELVLVHAIVIPEIPGFLRKRMPPPDRLIEMARLGAEQRMRELATSLGAKLILPEIRVGLPAEQFVRVCSEYNADLILVGPHGERTDDWGTRLGATAEQLVRSAPVPVLLATNAHDAAPHHLLVPVNDSAIASSVVRWARFLTRYFHAEATALHVLGPPVFTSVVSAAALTSAAVWPATEPAHSQAYEDADRWLTQLVNAGAGDTRMATTVVFGDPGEEIVAAAERTHADLIVMGSRGLTGLPRIVLGSVAGHVLRHAPCPILVVKKPEDEIVGEVAHS